jgi:hypothetical protein
MRRVVLSYTRAHGREWVIMWVGRGSTRERRSQWFRRWRRANPGPLISMRGCVWTGANLAA